MSTPLAKIDPNKCWICELQSEHNKKINSAKRIQLYICSEKCREIFIKKIKEIEDKQEKETEKIDDTGT